MREKCQKRFEVGIKFSDPVVNLYYMVFDSTRFRFKLMIIRLIGKCTEAGKCVDEVLFTTLETRSTRCQERPYNSRVLEQGEGCEYVRCELRPHRVYSCFVTDLHGSITVRRV